MRAKQFSAVSLLLAVFFGVRSGNRSNQPAPGNPAPSKVEKAYSSKGAKRLALVLKTASAKGGNNCNDTEKSKKLWWLSQESSVGCSLTLSPVVKEICALKPHDISNGEASSGENDLLDPSLAKEGQGLAEEKFRERCLGKLSPSIRFMMASVPNPRRTHLGLMTDRAIEAIEVAAAEAGFLPLSHYLPWPSPAAASADLLAPDSETQSDSTEPGLLIFHAVEQASEQQPKYLLIFLIPELPTEGVDHTVFSRALTLANKVTDKQGQIPFDGPLFSGSVESLKALDDELPGKQCIGAVSGSITNLRGSFSREKKGCSSLTTTQTSDCEAIGKFKEGAQAIGYRPEEIAILSEEGTAYGRQNEKCMAGLWFLHFPREISKLRNAYGAEAGKALPATASESSGQTDLGLQWQDSDAARRDELQTYGGQQTPLSQETVLSTLSITLKAQGIKVLGILATDPLDEAFLIHSVKKSSPDIRLFLRDPDLLFLRTPDVASLNGTLLISNYPLIPQNEFWSSTQDQPELSFWSWTQPHRERLITFPSAFQEGEYNAFAQLIEERGWIAQGTKMKRLEWDWPGTSASQDASEPFKSKRPLWLAAIGTAGHYPVKLLNNNEVNESALKLHSLELGPPQYTPFAFWGAIAGLGILHVMGLRLRGMVPAFFKRDFDVSDKSNTVTLVRISCHMMAILTIALAQLILGSSYLFFYRSGWRYSLLACLVGGVTSFLLWMAWAQFRMLYVLRRQQQELAVPDEHSRIIGPEKIFRISMIGAAAMVVAGAFWVGMTAEGRFDNAFLHFRNLNMSSGVAPALPIAAVLMVLYFGVWAYLRRLSYWEHRYVAMCNLKLDQIIRQNLGADVRAIDACLLGPLENGKWMAGFWLTLLVSIVAFRPWVTLDMIESFHVRAFVLFFLGLALLTLWLNWFRFINIWVHLRNILEHLENLPLRAAFQRLPREKSLPILHWSSSRNSFLLRQVLDRLRALAFADASEDNIALKTQFESRIDALMKCGVVETEMVEYRNVVGGSPRSGLRAFSRNRHELVREAREEMTNVIDTLSARLLDEYWKRGSSTTTADQESNPANSKYLLAEDIVALPFYAYIRKVTSELRNILFFLGIAVSLLFAAFHTYAFRADQAIDWCFFGLFAFMGGGIVLVIAQMEKNALLSRLSNTKAGELGTGFYLQLLKYGAVPFLTIFGSQVPSISNLLLKWVQPALEALH